MTKDTTPSQTWAVPFSGETPVDWFQPANVRKTRPVWAAGLLQGRCRHGDITIEPARRGEVGLGLLTHYSTGIMLTQAFLLLPRRGDGRPGFAAGKAFGIATAALPLLVMFPSMGYGWFGLRSGDAVRVNRIMLLGHTAFGVGIGLWAPRFAERPPRP